MYSKPFNYQENNNAGEYITLLYITHIHFSIIYPLYYTL